jgi:hypothetical protein
MTENSLDARELLLRVEADKRAERWLPLPPDDLAAARSSMREHPALVVLHDRWVLPDRFDPTQTGRGVKGLVLRLFGRLVFRVLAPYLRAERELLAEVVRGHDALAARCDELAQAMVRRQADEAQNGAKLAAWLHSELPGVRGVSDAAPSPRQ